MKLLFGLSLILFVATLSLLNHNSYAYAVVDTTAPVVTIKAPLNNSILPTRSGTTISVTATDTSGIKSIQIYIDSVLKKTCNGTTSCSYYWNFSGLTAGTHVVKAQATDKGIPANSGSATSTVTKNGGVATPTPTRTPTPTVTPTGIPTVTQPPTGTHPIQINANGSSVFVQKVTESLDQMKASAPTYYATVTQYVNTINFVRGSTNLAYVAQGAIDIDESSVATKSWIGGTIVHEAWHIKNYRQGSAYYGCAGETNSFNAQIAYLRLIGDNGSADFIRDTYLGVHGC